MKQPHALRLAIVYRLFTVMLMCSVYTCSTFNFFCFNFFGYCAMLYTLVQLDLLHGVHDDAGNDRKRWVLSRSVNSAAHCENEKCKRI
jgi:hypothetical protein